MRTCQQCNKKSSELTKFKGKKLCRDCLISDNKQRATDFLQQSASFFENHIKNHEKDYLYEEDL